MGTLMPTEEELRCEIIKKKKIFYVRKEE